jgi:hypothetical protein
MLDRLATLAEVGNAAAFLDEQAMAGERALNDRAPLLPALNDRARPLNAQRSTSHSHRVGGTSRSSCWSWTAGASAPKQLRRRMTAQLHATATGTEVTRCSRGQAHGTRPHQHGAGGAGSPAGSGAGHPVRSSGARPPAGFCPIDTTHSLTASPARPTASQEPSPAPTAPKEVRAARRMRPARPQPAGRTAPAGRCCSDAAVRVARRPQPGRSLLLSR